MLEPSTWTVCTAYWITTYRTSARNTISSVSLRKDFWRAGCWGAGGCAMCGCAIFSCSTSSEGDQFYRAGNLREEGRVAAAGAEKRQLQRLAEERVGEPHQVVCGDRTDLRRVRIHP